MPRPPRTAAPGAALSLPLVALVALVALPAGGFPMASQAAPDGDPGPGVETVLEHSRLAPWKAALPERERDPARLSSYAWRSGSWLSDDWTVEGATRYRIKIVYAWDLKQRILRETSFKVYGDGSETRYLEAILFHHGARDRTTAYLFFDDGLFADAVWTDDGPLAQRLDCDLVWPDGRTGRVRDVFLRSDDDAFRWVTYFARDGRFPEEPAFSTVMRRVAQGTVLESAPPPPPEPAPRGR